RAERRRPAAGPFASGVPCRLVAADQQVRWMARRTPLTAHHRHIPARRARQRRAGRGRPPRSLAMDAPTIRAATSNDLDDLCRLLDQLSEHPAPPDRTRSAGALEAILTAPFVQLLVAEQEGRLVGTVTLVVVPNLTHGGRP